jgi:hypothetical protein
MALTKRIPRQVRYVGSSAKFIPFPETVVDQLTHPIPQTEERLRMMFTFLPPLFNKPTLKRTYNRGGR